MPNKMNVLSLFNGMSVGSMALEDAGIKVNKTYISEIDKYANKATETIFPDSIQLGSVLDWREWDIDWPSIDLVTGGFPCQAWSMAGKQLGDKDERGMLFWTMLDIMKQVRHYNPSANFLIENVKMKKEFEEYITHHTENALGEVHKVLINSALVSAQNRNRYYWTSFPVSQPEDEGVMLVDVLESGFSDRKKSLTITTRISGATKKRYLEKSMHQMAIEKVNSNDRVFDITENERGYRPHKGDSAKSGISEMGRILKATADKTDTVTTSHAPKLALNGDIKDLLYRKLTPRECMRLQTIPEHYIDKLLESGISNTQLYKMTGNAWTMKVISHIFKEIKK